MPSASLRAIRSPDVACQGDGLWQRRPGLDAALDAALPERAGFGILRGIVFDQDLGVDAAAELVVYPLAASTTPGAPCLHEPGGCPTLTGAQLAVMAAEARGIAASLGSWDIVQLETTDSSLQRAAAGRNWDGAVYVATPQLLRAYGITAAQVTPDADILTMRPGLSGMTGMQLQYGAYKSGPRGRARPARRAPAWRIRRSRRSARCRPVRRRRTP